MTVTVAELEAAARTLGPTVRWALVDLLAAVARARAR